MKKRFDGDEAGPSMRDKIIGLGERSIRKSYYPQLQQQLEETERSRSDLEEKSAALLNMLEDLEQARSELAASQARYRALVENLNDVIFSLDSAGHITYISPVVQGLSGFTPEQVAGRWFGAFVHADDLPALSASFERALAGRQEPHEFRLLRADGAVRHVRVSGRPMRENGQVVGLTGVMSDITERKRNENVMEVRLRLLDFANAHSMHELLTATLDEIEALTGSSIAFYHFLEPDQKTLLLQDWSTNTLRNMCTAEGSGSHYDADQAGLWADCIRQRRPVIDNDYASLPNRKDTPEGHAPVVRELVVPIFRGNLIKAIIGVGNKATDYNEDDVGIVSRLGDFSWDIAERKRAEEALRESERHLSDIVEFLPDATLAIDKDKRITTWNHAIEEMTGVPATDMLGQSDYGYAIPFYGAPRPQLMELFWDPSHEVAATYPLLKKEGDNLVIEAFCPALYGGRGAHVWAKASVLRDANGGIAGAIECIRDITDRKEAEEALHHLNRELRAISECNQALIRVEDEQALLEEICRLICEEAAYRMAWVGYAENDEAKTVRPMAWAGVEDGYLASARITWADVDHGRGPTGTAIRTGESVCIQDFGADPSSTPWLQEALRRGYRSSIALPLKDNGGNTFGALNIYSAKPNAFTPDETRLLGELGGDLAFGIAALRTRAERREAEAQLRKLNETLELRVAEELAKNREKDHLLIQQSRLAAMGEMVHNIAHQWRQPLNALAIILANVLDDYKFGEQTEENLEAHVSTGKDILQRMSKTIDDFRDFFRPEKEKGAFSIAQCLREVKTILGATLANLDITLTNEVGEDVLAHGYDNEFSQVLLNVIDNAKEAIVARNPSQGFIAVRAERKGDIVEVHVTDNGGGVPETVLPKMFDPYFTTKEKGSGIGLYMSKKIIEGSMNGEISASNVEGGADVTIRIPAANASARTHDVVDAGKLV